MKKYSGAEIEDHLSKNLEDWVFEKEVITRDFEFKDFADAFSFMTAVALVAEKSDHHPDWSNVYNKVSVTLSTHSAGGITQLDFDLASEVDQIYLKFKH
jgi:4a-hydroxytetrahydrobiopterin dehydratase